MKSVCVSVSQPVSESVTQNELNALHRNLQPMFNKLATKVESQEMWLRRPIVFGGNPKYFYPQV